MAITVTDGKGAPLANVNIELTGNSVSRNEKTNDVGQASIPGLRAGTYRLRFSGEEVTAFEREVTLKPGDIAKLAITLSAAPPPKVITAPAPPAPPPQPKVGPLGLPQLGSLSGLADKERNAKERREIVLSCSGNTRNILLVLTDQLPQRVYEGAESTFYVISGQGGAIVGTYQSMITPGSFIAIPRGTSFTIGRQGNRPLAMLWTLSGEPCESAK